MSIRKLLLLFHLFHFFFNAQAQNYLPVARHFGVEDGLPHRQVNNIIQDRRGFIWVATEAGVARFDGLRFKIFNKAENGLSAEAIHRILEDAEGNLWLIYMDAFLNGILAIDMLDPISGRVTPLDEYIKEKPPIPLENLNLGITSISEGGSPDSPKKGTLFFGTLNPGGWVSWHPEQGWKRIIAPEIAGLEILSITPEHGVLGLVKDPRNGNHVFAELDAEGKVLRLFQGAEGNRFQRLYGNAKKPERYFALEEDKRTGQSIYWEIKAGADKKRLNLPLPKLRGPQLERSLLLEIGEGNLWLTEHDIFNEQGEIILDLLAQFPAINNRFIPNYFRDRNGGIWLGNSYGLEQIEVRKDHFRRYLYDKNGLDGSGYICRGILQEDNKLWVNTEGNIGGLYGTDLATGQVFLEQNGGSNYGLALGPRGSIWSGQDRGPDAHGELARIDKISGKLIETYSFDPVILWTIFSTKSEQLWCGTYKGLLFINPGTGQVTYPDYANFPELKVADVYAIQPDRNGVIWLCTSTGFYKISDKGKILERYWSKGKGDHWLPFDNFYHYYHDPEDVFWLGTGGGGLLRWDKKTGEKRLLSRTSGLLNNFVYAVYGDDFGHLWLPTNLGIAQFDKKTLSVRRTWGADDGITHNEFNRISHFKSADGTLYFGGLNGVTAFHPKDFFGQNQKPFAGIEQTGQKTLAGNTKKSLVLSDFKLFSGSSNKLESRTADLLASLKITLEPNDRYFQLEFALLDYFLPEKATYYYKIEGIDKDWNLLPEPLLRLSGLPFGRHSLKIRAEAAEGARAENELEFLLTVRPPIYLRWWFLLLATGLFFSVGYYFYRFQLNRRLAAKEAQRLQQLDTFKTRFYTNISHEFRTPLTVILGMVNSLKHGTTKEREKSTELIRRNSRQLLNLVNQLLDLSRVESGRLKISPSNGDLVTYLRFQLESFHSYAQTRGISLQFSSEATHLTMAFDHDKVQTILVNLISNAIKFTPEGGQIDLALQTIPQNYTQHPLQVILELSDTGVGIPEDQLGKIFDRFYQVDNSTTRKGEGSGIGLALVQELVKLMHGDITVESTPSMGTSFRIILPFTSPSALFSNHTGTQNIATDFLMPTGKDPVEAYDNDDKRPLLLIVEDNPDVRFYITECIRDEYRFALAANGADGIQKALELVPDIIISDVMMPEKDGFEVCDTLKNDERTSHIPLILLTAKADNASKIAGLRRGADAYLSKPFDLEELLVRLSMLVERQKRMVAYFSKKTDNVPVAETTEQKEAYEIEHAFIRKVRNIIEANFADENFALPQLCGQLNMSRSQLFRKLKALVNMPPSDFIRHYRLHKAKSLLETTELTVSEVAWQVGYKDVSHFSRSFQELFGFSPGTIGK